LPLKKNHTKIPKSSIAKEKKKLYHICAVDLGVPQYVVYNLNKKCKKLGEMRQQHFVLVVSKELKQQKD